VISKGILSKTIEEAARTVAARESDVNAARTKLNEAQRELRLLVELAQLRDIELSAAARSLIEETADAGGGNGSEGGKRDGTALQNAVVAILAEHGESMQIRQLMAAVQERGVHIPGSGQQANLIAYISRDPRVVRPSRGFYGLAEWGLQDTTPARKPKRRRRTGGKQR
jgi:hypothetical protein